MIYGISIHGVSGISFRIVRAHFFGSVERTPWVRDEVGLDGFLKTLDEEIHRLGL